MSLVGFCGSRHLSSSFLPTVVLAVRGVSVSGASVAVGCARGADLLVRSACPSAVVFRVGAPRTRGAFAQRSIRMVSSVSSLVAFVGGPCPVGLLPSASSRACFCGLGSGTWASLAFAVGRGLPVRVYWCSSSPVSLPAWGVWVFDGGYWSLAS